MKNNRNFIMTAMFMTLHTGFITASDFQGFDEDQMFGDDWDSSSQVEESSVSIHNNAMNNQNNGTATPLQEIRNYDDCFLSGGWVMPISEFGGNLQEILLDPIPMVTDEDLQDALNSIVDNHVEENVVEVVRAESNPVRHSQRFKKPVNFYCDDSFKQLNSRVATIVKKESKQAKKLIPAGSFTTWKINIVKNVEFGNDQHERSKQQAAIRRKIQITAAAIIKEGNLLQYSLEDQEDIKIHAARLHHKKMLEKGYSRRNKKLAKLVKKQK